MAERITDLCTDAEKASASCNELLRASEWDRAHGQSRVLLSIASRLHARLTGIVEAQRDLNPPEQL